MRESPRHSRIQQNQSCNGSQDSKFRALRSYNVIPDSFPPAEAQTNHWTTSSSQAIKMAGPDVTGRFFEVDHESLNGGDNTLHTPDLSLPSQGFEVVAVCRRGGLCCLCTISETAASFHFMGPFSRFRSSGRTLFCDSHFEKANNCPAWRLITAHLTAAVKRSEGQMSRRHLKWKPLNFLLDTL